MELLCGRGTWRCAPEPGKRDDEFASMGHVALPNIGGVKADSAAKARVDGWGAAIPRADTTGPAGRKYE